MWLCSLAGTCDETAFGALMPAGFGLTALAAYGEAGGFAMLARVYEPRFGTRVSVRLISATGAREGRVLDEMRLAAPFTVDNFEGIAVVPRSPDGIRLYLISDDNGSTAQRTVPPRVRLAAAMRGAQGSTRYVDGWSRDQPTPSHVGQNGSPAEGEARFTP